jgi:hypothetical protein
MTEKEAAMSESRQEVHKFIRDGRSVKTELLERKRAEGIGEILGNDLELHEDVKDKDHGYDTWSRNPSWVRCAAESARKEAREVLGDDWKDKVEKIIISKGDDFVPRDGSHYVHFNFVAVLKNGTKKKLLHGLDAEWKYKMWT